MPSHDSRPRRARRGVLRVLRAPARTARLSSPRALCCRLRGPASHLDDRQPSRIALPTQSGCFAVQRRSRGERNANTARRYDGRIGAYKDRFASSSVSPSAKRMIVFPPLAHNRLLIALPPRQFKRLAPDLERIECLPGQVLADVDSPLHDIYFTETAVISVVAVYEDGGIIEMATVGREGCTGAQTIFGGRVSPSRLLVQIPGSATRMSRETFMRTMNEMPSFRALMHAYAQAFLEQVLVSVAC